MRKRPRTLPLVLTRLEHLSPAQLARLLDAEDPATRAALSFLLVTYDAPRWRTQSRDRRAVNAEDVDWAQLVRAASPGLPARSGDGVHVADKELALELVQHPLKAFAAQLVAELADQTAASRETLATCKQVVSSDPASAVEHVLPALVRAGGPAHCELVQVLVKDSLPPALLAEFALGLLLLVHDSGRAGGAGLGGGWTAERTVLWQKGILPSLGKLPEQTCRLLVQSLETAEPSARLAGLLFVLIKTCGSAAKPHAAALRGMLEKCSGVMVQQALSALHTHTLLSRHAHNPVPYALTAAP
jgi:hypothetical protein